MSSGLGGGRSFIKSPLSTTTSSSSSTLSESNNSQFAICTRKPRTPRKRPNQTYNEAAALLSTAYPTIFSAKKFPNLPHDFFSKDQSSQLLLPIRVIDQPKPRIWSSFYEIDSLISNVQVWEDDFAAESILDDKIEEGFIDNIMGATTGASELREIDSWFDYTMRNVLEVSPAAADEKKERSPVSGRPLLLKLNYDEVVNAWSDRGLPFPEELNATEMDSIDLFREGLRQREASVVRYKEKRGRRLMSKKISADQRPRFKGRFLRRPNWSPMNQI